jgi:integrase
MKTGKKILPKIRLYDYNGDLSKRWFIYWSENGKRIPKYKGINLYNTVKERERAAKKLIKYWEEQLSENVTGFGKTAYAKQYKQTMEFMDKIRVSLRKKTHQQYCSHLKIFFSWNERHPITTEQIEKFLIHLSEIGRTQKTIHNYYRTLRRVFSKTIDEDIMDKIEVKKGSSTPAQYFSQGQIKYLKSKMAAEKPTLWLAVQFVYYCFIRPNELRNLKVGDILLEEKKICIPKEVSKNKKTQYIVIPDSFCNTLEEALVGKNPALYVIGFDYKPVGMNWMSSRHQKFLRGHHFDTKRFKFYSWKHTGAVMAAKNKVHIKQLQMQLRHHSLDQVNQYLRQMGVFDMGDFSSKMPEL